jgi:hypothetical protein
MKPSKLMLTLAILALGMLVALGNAQPPDGGHPPDGGNPPDGGHPDGGHPDGGHPDGGHPDGGHPDGGHPDGGHPDGGHPDGGHYPGGSLYYTYWYSYPYSYYYSYPYSYYNNYPYYSYPYNSYPPSYPTYEQSCSVWTDKPSYKAGEMVTIYCNVPTGTTASFTEYMPDGSVAWQVGPKWIDAGTSSRLAQAWYPTGQRRMVMQTVDGCSSTAYFSVY